MKKVLTIITLLICMTASLRAEDVSASSFIKIKNGHFERDSKPYLFMGANFWQGMNLGHPKKLMDRALLLRELDQMKKIGITNLRVMAISEGPAKEPYRVIPAVVNTPKDIDDDLLQGLDFLLHEMGKRDMTAVVCLANFWPWSGGFAQWVQWFEGGSIPYPPPHPGGSWSTFQEYSSRFYANAKAVKAQQEIVKKVVSRVNSITKVPYANDPTIMAWELANEPRGGTHRKEFLKWISSSAKMIKSLDANHLITTGSEGDTLDAKDAGNNFAADHADSNIDYATIHVWVENWGVFDPKDVSGTYSNAVQTFKTYLSDHVQKAKTFKKPIVLEEFGLARDARSMDPKSTTSIRDRYYDMAFKESFQYMKMDGVISGVNFWAWSGEGRPSKPYGGLWKLGKSLLGDPPHEEQGWYGVYDSDASTMKVIQDHANEIGLIKLR